MPELCKKAEKLMDKLKKKDENKEEVKIQKPKIKKVGIDYKYDYKQPEENSKD